MLEANAAVVGLILFGFGIGAWAVLTTWQLRAVTRELHKVGREVAAIVEWFSALGFTLPEELRRRDRHSRRLLDDPPAGIPGVRRPVR